MLVCFLGLALASLAQATSTVLDFESLADSEVLSNQVAGISFVNATVLSAGLSLNEFEFPPRSGAKVVTDDGGAIRIDFAIPVSAVGGYFTYLSALTFNAFDSGLHLVGSDTSDFSSNLAMSGDAGSAPNEFLGVSFAAGISRILIQGDVTGGSFVLDDLTIASAGGGNVPEPNTLSLVFAALVLGVLGGAWSRIRSMN
jgi:hypothetical protein